MMVSATPFWGDLSEGGTNRDHSEIGPSSLRISKSDAAGDMIHKGRTCGDESETSAAADHQMNGWVTDTDLSETMSFVLIKHKEHTKYEAKEHDLPLVRQGRA